MTRSEVARVGRGTKTHAIEGDEWSYTRENRTLCGRVATAVEHYMSGRLIEVTCQQCTDEG